VLSSVETHVRTLLAAVALTVLVLGTTPGAQPRTAGIDRPTDAEVARALERVKKDPNLATDRTIRMLRWKRSQENTQESRLSEWLVWLGGLFQWVEQSARVIVWIVVAVLGGLLGIYLVRMMMARGAEGAFETFVPPTHVRDLDIRPESLPAEIGAAARALWDRGEHRAALALLYRGMLSRLAHVHRVPIRDSSTEGDCLSMAAGHLTQRKCEYTVLLVRVWQRFVYGGEPAEPSTVYALCHDFAPALDRAATLDAAARQGSR
jgi:hypothetical protein